MGTYFQSKEAGLAARKWVVIDAAGVPVGRVASEAAKVLRGKHKPAFTPHVDGGDFVIVINAGKVIFTGKKAQQKKYYRYSGYIGGMKETLAADMLERKPEKVIEEAVFGMLPSGPLANRIATKLKVYRGEEHPHAAQTPTPHPIDHCLAS